MSDEILARLDDLDIDENPDGLLEILSNLPCRSPGQMLWHIPDSPEPIACSSDLQQ